MADHHVFHVGTVLLLCATVLLLFSTISSPVIHKSVLSCFLSTIITSFHLPQRLFFEDIRNWRFSPFRFARVLLDSHRRKVRFPHHFFAFISHLLINSDIQSHLHRH